MANYLAGRELKVGDDVRQYGEPVPEADDWPDTRAWLSGSYITICDDAEYDEAMDRYAERIFDGLSKEDVETIASLVESDGEELEPELSSDEGEGTTSESSPSTEGDEGNDDGEDDPVAEAIDVLAQSIPKVIEYAEAADEETIRLLIELEGTGESPRTSLLLKLEALLESDKA